MGEITAGEAIKQALEKKMSWNLLGPNAADLNKSDQEEAQRALAHLDTLDKQAGVTKGGWINRDGMKGSQEHARQVREAKLKANFYTAKAKRIAKEKYNARRRAGKGVGWDLPDDVWEMRPKGAKYVRSPDGEYSWTGEGGRRTLKYKRRNRKKKTRKRKIRKKKTRKRKIRKKKTRKRRQRKRRKTRR